MIDDITCLSSLHKYIFFKPAYLVNIACSRQFLLTGEIVSLLLRSVQAESGYMQQFGLPGTLRTV